MCLHGKTHSPALAGYVRRCTLVQDTYVPFSSTCTMLGPKCRRLLRSVHPDLFNCGLDEAQQANTRSLQLLQDFVGDVQQGRKPKPVRLDFHVQAPQSGTTRSKTVHLHGSMLPLYEAFQLCSEEELQQLKSDAADGPDGQVSLEWLRAKLKVGRFAASNHQCMQGTQLG